MISRAPASPLDIAVLAAAAAISACVGPALFRREHGAQTRGVGFADALAAGMMLGVGYSLMAWGIGRAPTSATLSAAVGVGLMYWLHRWLDIAEVPAPTSPRAAFVGALIHAIPEGIALGAAAALGRSVAIVVALTLALHNISESAVLGSRLRAAGRGLVRASTLAVVSNLPQIILGLAALVAATRAPAVEGPMLGFSFGALAYLCFAELLPESYRLAGRSSIAIVVTIAAGIVALVTGSA